MSIFLDFLGLVAKGVALIAGVFFALKIIPLLRNGAIGRLDGGDAFGNKSNPDMQEVLSVITGSVTQIFLIAAATGILFLIDVAKFLISIAN